MTLCTRLRIWTVQCTNMHNVMLHGKKHRNTVFTLIDELLYEAIVLLLHSSHPSCENEFICITANIMVLRV